MPKISVVLPVYNGERYLLQAIDSVLSQTLHDLELIVIDDGSNDGSFNLVERIMDPRVRLFRQTNQGLAATLNRGIALAKGEYIARQDQDDVCFPSRLQMQACFLDAHADVGIVGTAAEVWAGETRTKRLLQHPTEDVALKFEMLFDNHFVHSSVMIRRVVFDRVGSYSVDPARQPPEDYELWSRILRHFKVANLPDVLMAYREVPGSMSRTGIRPFLRNLIAISVENIAWASGSSHNTSEVVAAANLAHGVYDTVPEKVTFSKIRTLIELAASNIANQANLPTSQLHIAVDLRIQKLRYRFWDHKCGGHFGRALGSNLGRQIRGIAQRLTK